MAAEVVVQEVLVLTWEWAPSPRKICGCVPLPVWLHLLYGSPEEGRGPLGRGVSSFEGWMALRGRGGHSQHSGPPLSPTRYRLGGKVNGKCDPLLNDLGGDKRRLIDTTYLPDDSHVIMWPSACAAVTWWARKSLQVAKTEWCPGDVWYIKHFDLRCIDGNIVLVVARLCGSGVSSVARYQTQDYNLISLSGARNHFFLLLRVMWSALNTNTGKLLNADQSTIAVREMVN